MYALTKPKLIQLIHIARQQLGMDDLTYRTMLKGLTGKQSTKEMRMADLLKVFDEIKAKGFKVRSKQGRSPATSRAKVRSNITHKIRAMWIDMHKSGIVRDGSEWALNKFMHNTLMKYKFKQPHALIKLNVQSLNDYEATQLLEILKQWKRRASK
ncbi:hypothetical protein A6046_03275 [[Haemophilus] ducreyi]|uniref:Mu-like phage E16 protein n=1 Tax=Haemophilus ducreyi TaxID=730 RepID=A0AAC8ZA26_HAEDC|nr:regulatory protein GemA [[Haemophilus] ducreyi]AKO30288.1 hypothetical protein RY60_00425 [[Haemophilus] ducreyi]AKO31721.1 hypothetical protein RZ57_00430 [[Haemophilus] ducreyi]AKO33174.1 hypothetical protein RZ58_00430 [[Haemophilus] ducreyi]AKO34623.1 hypothetical protein RZ59_00425 [[Haemophilus] ducreyi]AKO36054.1 hypothetical protein RZ61_00420 [[Haemophilus] ducreyi]